MSTAAQSIIDSWEVSAARMEYGQLVNFAVGMLESVATMEGLSLADRRAIVGAIRADLDA